MIKMPKKPKLPRNTIFLDARNRKSEYLENRNKKRKKTKKNIEDYLRQIEKEYGKDE